jgi:hypothetical protein
MHQLDQIIGIVIGPQGELLDSLSGAKNPMMASFRSARRSEAHLAASRRTSTRNA